MTPISNPFAQSSAFSHLSGLENRLQVTEEICKVMAERLCALEASHKQLQESHERLEASQKVALESVQQAAGLLQNTYQGLVQAQKKTAELDENVYNLFEGQSQLTALCAFLSRHVTPATAERPYSIHSDRGAFTPISVSPCAGRAVQVSPQAGSIPTHASTDTRVPPPVRVPSGARPSPESMPNPKRRKKEVTCPKEVFFIDYSLLKCASCSGLTFLDKKLFVNHLQSNHGSVYLCPESSCEKQFSAKKSSAFGASVFSHIIGHFFKVERANSFAPYLQCEFCGDMRVFQSVKEVSEHKEKVHKKEERVHYSCRICEKDPDIEAELLVPSLVFRHLLCHYGRGIPRLEHSAH